MHSLPRAIGCARERMVPVGLVAGYLADCRSQGWRTCSAFLLALCGRRQSSGCCMGSGGSGLGRVQVEDGAWYDEDPWEDWDWEEPDEPQVTYKQAVESLRALSKDHADIRVEWNGRRGPRSDARLVFEETAGNGGLRVRMRSAAQFGDLKQIITSA